MTGKRRLVVLCALVLMVSSGCARGPAMLPGDLGLAVGEGTAPSLTAVEAPTPVHQPEDGPEDVPETAREDAREDAREGAEAGALWALSRYLELTDLITSEGGNGPERIGSAVTESWYPVEQEGFADYREEGTRTVGRTLMDTLTMISARRTPAGLLEVHAVACVDASRVWVLGPNSPLPPDDLLQWLLTSPPPEVSDEATLEAWQVYLDEATPKPGRREPVSFWFLGERASTLRLDATENWLGVDPCVLPEDLP